MEIPCSWQYHITASLPRRARTTLAIMVLALIPGCDDPLPVEPDIVPGSMVLAPTSFSLTVGESASFSVTVTDATGSPMANAPVLWNSSDHDVISVSGSGATATVTAIGPGEATIWAAAGNASASAAGTSIPADGFQAAVQPLFTANCAFSGCHGGPRPQAGMDLTEGAAYQNLVRVASRELSSMSRVQPFDPANSYLVHKLQGTQGTVGGRGAQMPRGRDPLSQADIDAVINWVKTGARNN